MRLLRIILVSMVISVVSLSIIAQKKVKFPTYQQGKKCYYEFQAPRGFKSEKRQDYHGSTELVLYYADSSMMFITNDDESGSAINRYKLEKYGEGILLKILAKDTNVFSNCSCCFNQMPIETPWRHRSTEFYRTFARCHFPGY